MNRQALGARHQRVQRLRRLVRRPSARATERAFVAEGVKVVSVALDRKAPVECLFVAAEGRDEPAVVTLAERVLDAGARVFDLGPGVMERVADTVTPQPVCAVVGDVTRPLEEIVEAGGRERVLLVCVDVRDPGNLGAIMRSGAASGAAGVVCCEGSVDPFNPKAVRASAGAVFDLPITAGMDPAAAFELARSRGFRLVATTARGGTDYAAADLSSDVAIVLGNESSGLPDELVEMLDDRVTIPMAASAESLNVAMTATVLCFEAARRRRLS